MAKASPKKAAGPVMHAQDKLTFLLTLVPYLIECEQVSVAEAAEHFMVSPEQIRQAVRMIAVSGVPGATATYQSDDLFDIAWDDFEENDEIVLTHRIAIEESPRFSAREAAALIAGLQYLSSLPENTDRAALATLMSKMTKGAASEPVQVGVSTVGASSTLTAIRAAVEAGTQLELEYLSAQGVSERRMVDPIRVESVDADWYLRGWCHLRGAARAFRLDRITSITVTDTPRADVVADVVLRDTLFDPSDNDLLVTIDVEPGAEILLAEYVPDGAIREERDGIVRTTVRVSHYHGLKRLIAGMSGMATVVEPAEARAVVEAWAAAAVKRYP
jgi:proteasome accessory factor C